MRFALKYDLKKILPPLIVALGIYASIFLFCALLLAASKTVCDLPFNVTDFANIGAYIVIIFAIFIVNKTLIERQINNSEIFFVSKISVSKLNLSRLLISFLSITGVIVVIMLVELATMSALDFNSGFRYFSGSFAPRFNSLGAAVLYTLLNINVWIMAKSVSVTAYGRSFMANFANTASQGIVVYSVFVSIVLMFKRNIDGEELFACTEVSTEKQYFGRMLLVFAVGTLVTLFAMAQTTITLAVANGLDKAYGIEQTYNLSSANVFGLQGRHGARFLMSFGVGLFAVVFYTIISFTEFIKAKAFNKLDEKSVNLVSVFYIIAAFFINLYVVGFLDKLTFWNFNVYLTADGVKHTIFAENMFCNFISKSFTEGKFVATFNFLNVGVLLFQLIFVGGLSFLYVTKGGKSLKQVLKGEGK